MKRIRLFLLATVLFTGICSAEADTNTLVGSWVSEPTLSQIGECIVQYIFTTNDTFAASVVYLSAPQLPNMTHSGTYSVAENRLLMVVHRQPSKYGYGTNSVLFVLKGDDLTLTNQNEVFRLKRNLTIADQKEKWSRRKPAPSQRSVERFDPSQTTVNARSWTDQDMKRLGSFKNLRLLDFAAGRGIGKANISDEGLKTLSALDLPKLETLTLGYCDKITGDGLLYLPKLKTVKHLNLMASPNVNDDGLKHLVAMSALDRLDLRGCTGVTDKGLEHLEKMKNLKEISLGGCDNVSATAVKKLQDALPECKVEKDEKEWSYHKKF